VSTPLIDLFDAIGRRDEPAAAAALAAGADINGVLERAVRTNSGWVHPDVPPVVWAARKHPPRIPWLVARGADINAVNGALKGSPLSTASRQGLSIRAIKGLLDAGADTDHMERDGETALHYAAMKGKLKVVNLLLARGADPNLGSHDKHYGLPGVPTYTPLYKAAVRDKPDVALALLAAGANPNTGTATSWLQCPLGMAIKHGDAALCEALVKAGARTDGDILSADLQAKLADLLT